MFEIFFSRQHVWSLKKFTEIDSDTVNVPSTGTSTFTSAPAPAKTTDLSFDDITSSDEEEIEHLDVVLARDIQSTPTSTFTFGSSGAVSQDKSSSLTTSTTTTSVIATASPKPSLNFR